MKPIISKNASDKSTMTTFTYVATLVIFLLWMSILVYAACGGEEFFMYRYLRVGVVALGIIGVFMIITTICVFICGQFTNEPLSRSDKTFLLLVVSSAHLQ